MIGAATLLTKVSSLLLLAPCVTAQPAQPTPTSAPTHTAAPAPVHPTTPVRMRPVRLPWQLRCLRARESGGDYSAVNAGSGAAGAFQLMPAYADEWARRYGAAAWASVDVIAWPRAVQDRVALRLWRDFPGAWAPLGDCA